MAIGIVTNTEIEDATPAAMIAHTRRRAAYDEIVEQFFAAKPDVLMGGGSANFLPSAAAGKRKDDVDYVAKFRDAGYQVAKTAGELNAAISNVVVRLLSRYAGRGPTKARTVHSGKLVLCVLEDTMTTAERSLAAGGREGAVLEGRHALQHTMREELTAAIDQQQ